ncbi:MAG: 30S ribosomal protein S12 methylthiotransferase RimO [Anaerolineae bacterium]|nr:30S ribosomal protein S12 methylthiotransferase RimO [Anaerolineae bacterium]
MGKQGKRKPPRERTYFLLSLGCAKNTVDAEGMATLLERAGFEPVSLLQHAEVVIVNTCGFIAPAREESLAALQELADAKRPGQVLLAAGCWSQRDPQAILAAVPGVDGVLGTRRWMDVVDVVQRVRQPGRTEPVLHLPDTPTVGRDERDVPRVAAQGASAYLKIADGCSRTCAFCAIPLIKGPAVSRPAERILDEAAMLAEWGVKEIVLIAQDTTTYGRDVGGQDGLADLLERMAARVPQVPWLRVMYAFPGAITPRLIEVMADLPQVLPYVDIPLQHAHPDVLRRMRRPADVDWMRRTAATLRERIPGIAIRTTFVVGFPGETDAEFAALVDFVAEMAFDRVGVFTYSHEEGTPAAALRDDVPEAVKEERRGAVMEVQQPISLAKNQALVGQTLDVLVEGQGEGLSVGRSYRDAPEIDGLVLMEEDAPVGEIVAVEVTGAMEYDVVGRVV